MPIVASYYLPWTKVAPLLLKVSFACPWQLTMHRWKLLGEPTHLSSLCIMYALTALIAVTHGTHMYLISWALLFLTLMVTSWEKELNTTGPWIVSFCSMSFRWWGQKTDSWWGHGLCGVGTVSHICVGFLHVLRCPPTSQRRAVSWMVCLHCPSLPKWGWVWVALHWKIGLSRVGSHLVPCAAGRGSGHPWHWTGKSRLEKTSLTYQVGAKVIMV